MIDPLPNWRSIWVIANSKALAFFVSLDIGSPYKVSPKGKDFNIV